MDAQGDRLSDLVSAAMERAFRAGYAAGIQEARGLAREVALASVCLVLLAYLLSLN